MIKTLYLNFAYKKYAVFKSVQRILICIYFGFVL